MDDPLPHRDPVSATHSSASHGEAAEGTHSPKGDPGDSPVEIVSAEAAQGVDPGRWTSLARAISFLFSGDAKRVQPIHEVETGGTGRHWFVPLGFLIGLLWMGAYRATWRLFGDPEVTQVRVLPALAVVWLELAFTGRCLATGFVACGFGRVSAEVESAGRDAAMARVMLRACLAALGLWVLVVGLPDRIGWYAASGDWRSMLNPIFPLATYRPLLLAPMWGRWAILLAARIGRPAANADADMRALSAAASVPCVLGWLMPILFLSAFYVNREGRAAGALLAGLGVLLTAYLFAAIAAQRRGGQDRHSVHACGFAAQLVFLALYRWLCI